MKRKGGKKQRHMIFTDECMPMHTLPHNEIINFTGVERTNTEINVRLFDNANVYMTKKQKGGKYQMTDI